MYIAHNRGWETSHMFIRIQREKYNIVLEAEWQHTRQGKYFWQGKYKIEK